MDRNTSNFVGSKRDLLRRGSSAFLFWCLPWCAFALGFGRGPGLRTILWSTSLAVMGVACLINASRCGRVHCRFTGPFFILCAVISLSYGLGLLPLEPSGWKWIGRRDNHWRSGPLLHSGTVFRPLSTKRLSGLTNR